MKLEVRTPARFHFAATVESHGWYRLAPFRWEAETKVLERTETLGGEAIDLEIRHEVDHLVIDGRRLSKTHHRELELKLRRMFQLHVDLTEFLELCALSMRHRHAAKRGFGRLLCGSTLFEDIVKIILTTNVTWRQTVRMVELLVERAGPSSASGRRAFPSAEEIARIPPETLQSACRLGYRAKYIHELASGIADDSIDIVAIADPLQSTDELFRSYQLLPGVGPYGAAHLLAMDGRHDFIAVDTEFRRFVREEYHGGRDVKDATMLRHYRMWGRWKYLGYWAELWESVGEEFRREEKKPKESTLIE